MKKLLTLILTLCLTITSTSCVFSEISNDNKNVVNLGNEDTFVKWTLVANDNEFRPVTSAYFEFNNTKFKYYEDGNLKKEGTHRITFFDIETNNAPLHLNLEFGKDDTGLSIFDYIDCYTEDPKDDLRQFTIISEGYHIKPLRSGGVPVRDYHLSEMPYAFGTYVKEGASKTDYNNGKVNYLNSAKLDGTFVDDKGNKFTFINNSYSSKYQTTEYSTYTVYMRYENALNNTFIEGTVKMSNYDEFLTNVHHDVALIYVLHGENEPAEEKGTYASADYQLIDFVFNKDNSLTFNYGSYFYDNKECEYLPENFIGGTYYKIN